jgi:hypothetical protein
MLTWLLELSEAISAAVVLAAIGGAGTVAYVLAFVARPRFATPGRSIDVDAFVRTELYPEVMKAAREMGANIFLAYRLTPDDFVDFFAKYDEHTAAKPIPSRMQAIRKLAVQARARTDPAGVRVHMLLNQYRPSLVAMYDARYRASDIWGMFRLYLGDTARSVWNEKIKRDTWGEFWADVDGLSGMLTDGYLSLEDIVKSLPWRLVDGQVPDPPATAQQVQEGFEPILRPLRAIVQFFRDVILAIPMIFKLLFSVAKLILDPWRMALALLGLVIGVIILVLFMLGKALLSVLALLTAIMIIAALDLLISAAWLAILLVATALVLVLCIADLLSRGKVVGPVMRCEDHPDAWMSQRAWALGNRVQRVPGLAGMCAHPCPDGWVPWLGGAFCRRHKQRVGGGGLCPQQALMLRHLGKLGGGTTTTGPAPQPPQPCFVALEHTKALSLAVCSSASASADTLEECRRAFCTWRLSPGGHRVVATDGASHSFCAGPGGTTAAQVVALPSQSYIGSMVAALAMAAVSGLVLSVVNSRNHLQSV